MDKCRVYSRGFASERYTCNRSSRALHALPAMTPSLNEAGPRHAGNRSDFPASWIEPGYLGRSHKGKTGRAGSAPGGAEADDAEPAASGWAWAHGARLPAPSAHRRAPEKREESKQDAWTARA
eukprot:3651518-Lingulodinium_polyedra.AAC.1